ncbi:uncharacterized protein G2W53_004833 [Senna tora]|uniref:Reverse transcriptase domain-containing protein n=1 Tax=Senna tora TaxID=362788 RepID=A0A835CJP1_9FABA|nr:uncharacterized protein G2W53_004833 [Senna tora]
MPRGKKKKRVVEISPPPVRGRKTRRRAISHSLVRSPISPSSPESTHSEEAEMTEQNNRNVSDYATPKLDGLQHSIRRPSIQANNFKIKPATIQLLQANGQFGGSPIEDPNNHILNFLEICDTFKHNGKLKSRWSGPFLVTKVTPYGAVEVKDEKTSNVFLTNGQRLKHYWGGDFERTNSVVIFEPP